MALQLGNVDKSSGILFNTLLQPTLPAKSRRMTVASRLLEPGAKGLSPFNPTHGHVLPVTTRNRRVGSEKELPPIPNRLALLPAPVEARRGSIPYTRKLDLKHEVITPRKYRILVRRSRRGGRAHDTIKEWNVKGDFNIADLKVKQVFSIRHMTCSL
jgi:hypothetical protein